jgi:hypothetical protein
VTAPAATISAAAGQYAPPLPSTSQLARIGSSPPPSTAENAKQTETPV